VDVNELNKALEKVADNQNDESATSKALEKSECLGFVLGNELFAIPILRVEEIRGWERPSILPDTKDFVKGVINLRGSIIPVVDLRERFLQSAQRYLTTTVVIVLRIFYADSEDKIVGIVADSVTDVIQYHQDDLVKLPEMNDSIAEGFVKGILQHQQKVYFMLDIDPLLHISQF